LEFGRFDAGFLEPFCPPAEREKSLARWYSELFLSVTNFVSYGSGPHQDGGYSSNEIKIYRKSKMIERKAIDRFVQ